MKAEQTFEDFLEEIEKESPDFVKSMGVEYFKNIWDTQKVMRAQMLAFKKAFASCTTTKSCLVDFKNLDPDDTKRFLDYTALFEQKLLATLRPTAEKTPFKIYAGPGIVCYLKLLRSFHSEKENLLGVYKEGYIETADHLVYVYKVPPKPIDSDYILVKYEDGTFAKYLLDGLDDYFERKIKVQKDIDFECENLDE